MARKQEGPGDGAAPDLSKHKFALFCSPSGEGLRTLAGWEAPGIFSKGFEVIGRESSFQTLPGNVPGLPLGLSEVVSEETTRSGHRGLRVPCFLVFTLLYFLFLNIFFPFLPLWRRHVRQGSSDAPCEVEFWSWSLHHRDGGSHSTRDTAWMTSLSFFLRSKSLACKIQKVFWRIQRRVATGLGRGLSLALPR